MPAPAPNPPQTITERATNSLLDLAKLQVTNGLDDFGSAASNLPEFLAGPTPQSAAALPLYAITRAACRTYARGFGPQTLPGFDAAWGAICNPYLETIGEDPDSGSLGPPFEGGQCVGVDYRIEFSYDNDQGVRSFIEQIVQGILVGTYSRPAQFGRTDIGYVLRDSSGIETEFRQVTRTAPGPGNPAVRVLFRIDGQPDNCGNPPTLYQPPTVQPNLPAVGPTFADFPGIGPVGVEVTFGPDGEVIISFPDIDGTVTIPNPFGPDGGDGAALEPTPPGFQGVPGDPQDVGDGDAAEGVDPVRNLLGVLVQTISYPPRVNRLFNPTESYTKGAYYVYLGGDAGLILIDTAAITRQDQFFPAPPGSNRFRVTPNAGFTLRVTPYYGEE